MLLVISNSPAVWLIATLEPVKLLLVIFDLPPLTTIPPFATLTLTKVALAEVIVKTLSLKLTLFTSIFPAFNSRLELMFESVIVNLDESSVDTLETSLILVTVTVAPSLTLIVPVNLLPLKFKVKFWLMVKSSVISFGISMVAPSVALSIASRSEDG